MDNRQQLQDELEQRTVEALQEAVSKGVSRDSILLFCFHSGINSTLVYERKAA